MTNSPSTFTIPNRIKKLSTCGRFENLWIRCGSAGCPAQIMCSHSWLKSSSVHKLWNYIHLVRWLYKQFELAIYCEYRRPKWPSVNCIFYFFKVIRFQNMRRMNSESINFSCGEASFFTLRWVVARCWRDDLFPPLDCAHVSFLSLLDLWEAILCLGEILGYICRFVCNCII